MACPKFDFSLIAVEDKVNLLSIYIGFFKFSRIFNMTEMIENREPGFLSLYIRTLCIAVCRKGKELLSNI